MAKSAEKTGLGLRIAKARDRAGISQTELGRACGLTRSAVSQWESGGTEPTSANLRTIAVKCSVDYDWLATGRGFMSINDQDPQLIEAIQLFSEADPETRSAMILFLQARKLATSQQPVPESEHRPRPNEK